MPKIKKLKRRKRFRANVNRKRMRNKMRKMPNIECKEIAEAWKGKSIIKNLREMGLAADPNSVLGVPNIKKNMLQFAVAANVEEGNSDAENKKPKKVSKPRKAHVAESLEKDAKWSRARLFRLPTSEVLFATYMMDKHGDDYKAMERDHKNFNQLTLNQIKQKIERFKSVPEQYALYLVKKGEFVLDDPAPLKKIKPQDILIEPVQKKSESKRSRRKRKKASLLQTVAREEGEDEDDVDFNTSKTLDDEMLDSQEGQSNKKKLKLFADDNSDNEDEDENSDNDDEDDDEEEDDDDDDDDDSLDDDDSEDDDEDEKITEDDSDSEAESDEEIKILKSKTPNLKNKQAKILPAKGTISKNKQLKD